jgi:class 3 adenylate cyclase
MGTGPTGVVTFLFTDIEGSTRIWEQHPRGMRDTLALHDELLREGFARHSGFVFGILGDGFAVAFSSPADAIEAAVDVQAALHETDWPHGGDLRVRIAIDSGVTDERDDEYYGTPLNRLGRIMKEVEGGTSVITSTTAHLAHDVLGPDVELHNGRTIQLEGLEEPVEIHEIRNGNHIAAEPP